MVSVNFRFRRRSCWRLKFVSLFVVPFLLLNQLDIDLESKFEQKRSAKSILIPTSPDLVAVETVREAIGDVIRGGPSSPLDGCNPTAQVQLILAGEEENDWILQSLDADGDPKTVGGDEYYIYYADYADPEYDTRGASFDPTAVAIPQDLHNGKYKLEFFFPPILVASSPSEQQSRIVNLTGTGKLTIHFLYTCGIGAMPRPTKNTFKNNGSINRVHAYYNISRPPKIQVLPTTATNQQTNSGDNVIINLSTYRTVICAGDSIMNNFCGMFWTDFRWRKPNVVCKGNLGGELSIDTVNDTLAKYRENYETELLSASSTNDVAILVGSAIWDLLEPRNERTSAQGLDFSNHLEACRQLIRGLQTTYPNVAIYWKLPTAVHVHNVNTKECYRREVCVDRIRYMSNGLMNLLYMRQKQLMENELHIPTLDLFNVTYLSASWLMPGDGRHYRYALNELTNNYYYRL